MAYTPDLERGRRRVELSAKIRDRLTQYRPGESRREVTKWVMGLTGLSAADIDDVIEYGLFFEQYASDTDEQNREVAAFLAASAVAEKAIYGFCVD